MTHPSPAFTIPACCRATVCQNEMLVRIKRLFRLVPQPVNMELGQIVLWYLNFFLFCFVFVFIDKIKRRSGIDAFYKALGCVLTL